MIARQWGNGADAGAQLRAKPLATILAAGFSCAAAAGLTRLADITWLDTLGFPIFQAVRPKSRSLTTAMGRGPTRRAAIASALLEAIETDLAERIEPQGVARSLATMSAAADALWRGDERDALAIRLDGDVSRFWLPGVRLDSGAVVPVPFDLVSQDLTRPAPHDTLTATIGLATGGDRAESQASAIAELLEHDFDADWRRAAAQVRRRCEIDLTSITDPVVVQALARVAAAACTVYLWSTGQDYGVAAIQCFIVDGPCASTRLPPVGGGGCHPDRAVAALRAITEAAQGRAALLAGARDDLEPRYYRRLDERRVELVLSSLCFGPGPLAWQLVPTHVCTAPAAALACLAAVAGRRSSLPLIVVSLPAPHPDLDVVKVIAPGLRIAERDAIGQLTDPPLPTWRRRRPRADRRLVFVGSTLWSDRLPVAVERRPPAVAGDLSALLNDPPLMVGLIDGRFETAPAVWHKEVLDLIAAGTVVFGAASIGALRAAELAGDGMIGVGTIFALYRDGVIVRDDAVLLSHAPAALDFCPLTLPLVDVEFALLASMLDPLTRRRLQRIARTLSFRVRTWPAMVAEFHARHGCGAEIDVAALAGVPSLKRLDALRLVDRLTGPLPVSPQRPRPPLTSYYRRLLARDLAMPP